MPHRFAASFLLLISLASLAAAQVVAQRVRVSSGVASGLVLSKVDPLYPPLARQARIQGTVVLQVIINRDGDVDNLQLISGHPMLAPAAITAVKQWKYKPYLLNGEPVMVETQVQVNFQLSDKPPAQGIAGDQPGGIPPDQPAGLATSTPQDLPRSGAVPQRVRVSSGVILGLLRKKVQPDYPQEAKDARIQGTVLLQVEIDKEGNIDKVQLISGHPLLAPAAIDAVKQWKYRPYLLNGEPVYVDTQVQVNFTLAN